MNTPYGPLTYMGEPIIGAKLRARPNAVANRSNKIVPGSGSFQWLREGQPIDGAIGSVYVVRPEDLCHRISLKYSFKTEDGREDFVLSKENLWAVDTPAQFVLDLYRYPNGLNREPHNPDGFLFWVQYLQMLEATDNANALSRLVHSFTHSPAYVKEVGLA